MGEAETEREMDDFYDHDCIFPCLISQTSGAGRLITQIYVPVPSDLRMNPIFSGEGALRTRTHRSCLCLSKGEVCTALSRPLAGTNVVLPKEYVAASYRKLVLTL